MIPELTVLKGERTQRRDSMYNLNKDDTKYKWAWMNREQGGQGFGEPSNKHLFERVMRGLQRDSMGSTFLPPLEMTKLAQIARYFGDTHSRYRPLREVSQRLWISLWLTESSEWGQLEKRGR